jgi:carbamate kinase
MKLVIAIGGNALLKRGQALTAANQLDNIRTAAVQLARVAADHQLVLTHGNGPQVGLLALQAAAYKEAEVYPLDLLGAQTDGMIGYLIEQELANALPQSRTVATLLTRVEVDPQDSAFQRPTKPIGPVYTEAEGARMAAEKHWVMAPDGKGVRRVVASPKPLRVLGLDPIRWLLEHQAVVIAAGGGGIPVARNSQNKGDASQLNRPQLHGVDAVIDKDLCSGLLARGIGADCLVIVTDVAAVFLDWSLPGQRAVRRVNPQALMRALDQHLFPAGSMGPKVQAACEFVQATGNRAVIGSLDQIEALLSGDAGTQVCVDGGSSL